MFLTLTDKTNHKNGEDGKKEDLWAVYMVHPHTCWREEREMVGIVTSGVPADHGYVGNTTYRESHFPFELIKNLLSIRVEMVEALKDEDSIQISNSIIGHNDERINDNPPTKYWRFNLVDNGVITFFVSTMGCMKRMAKKPDDVWK